MRGWVYAIGFMVGCGLKELDLIPIRRRRCSRCRRRHWNNQCAPILDRRHGHIQPMELDDDESSDADEGVDDPFDTADEADIDELKTTVGPRVMMVRWEAPRGDADDGPPAHGKALALYGVTPSPIVAALDTAD